MADDLSTPPPDTATWHTPALLEQEVLALVAAALAQVRASVQADAPRPTPQEAEDLVASGGLDHAEEATLRALAALPGAVRALLHALGVADEDANRLLALDAGVAGPLCDLARADYGRAPAAAPEQDKATVAEMLVARAARHAHQREHGPSNGHAERAEGQDA